MGSAGDNFCLRWNDFEANVSNSFRELRNDNEFFDVTLCCDNGIDRLQAHKVILAACSPLFRRLLSPSSSGTSARQGNGSFVGTHVNSQPLLYMKGIQHRELEAVLNFMYHGEVNVAQDSLNAFLNVAEELAVKGLTTESKGDESIRNSGSQNRARAKGELKQEHPELGPEDFLEGDTEFTPTKKGNQSLKRISFGGEMGTLRNKNYGPGKAEKERMNISGQLGVGSKKRVSEGTSQDSSLVPKRVKTDLDGIQISETTSLTNPEHSTSTEAGHIDTGEFVDDGSGDPDFDDSYGYSEADLDDTGTAKVSSGEATKDPTVFQQQIQQDGEDSLHTMDDYITRNNMGTYWCKGCGQHACSRKDLTRHIEAKHLNNIYKCKYCGFTINTRYGLQRHLNKQHKQPGMSINEIMKWHMD